MNAQHKSICVITVVRETQLSQPATTFVEACEAAKVICWNKELNAPSKLELMQHYH